MASRILELLNKKREKHAVGNINSAKVTTIAHGCVAKEDMENYSLVEVAFNADGEREIAPLSDLTKEAYLVCATEEMYTVGAVKDTFADFYVGQGEKVRVAILNKGFRFETSLFELKSGVDVAKKGMYAVWDVSKKKYVIQSEVPTSGVKLLVVEVEKASTLDGLKCMRFEVQ